MPSTGSGSSRIMNRREFMRLSGGLAGLPRCPGTASIVAASAPIPVRESFVRYDRRGAVDLRKSILGEDYRIVSNAVHDYLLTMDELDEQPAHAWMLWAEHGNARWLLDFHESEEPLAEATPEGFMPWLAWFSPRNCNDWLMVRWAYLDTVIHGTRVGWGSGAGFAASRLLDETLSVTRGYLFWDWQFEQLVATSCKVDINEARSMLRAYRKFLLSIDSAANRFKPSLAARDVARRFDETVVESRTLTDVIQERAYRGIVGGRTPDYQLAGFLSEHLIHALKIF